MSAIAVGVILKLVYNRYKRIQDDRIKWECAIRYHLNCLKTYNKYDSRDNLRGFINASANGDSVDFEDHFNAMDNYEDKKEY